MLGDRFGALVLILVLASIAATTPLAAAQTLQWDELWGGAGSDEARGVAVSPDGSYVYMAGYTEGFGAGGFDALLVKYSSGGSLMGERLWGGAGSDVAYGVAVSPGGSYVYIAGGTLSFGAGEYDALLTRYGTSTVP